MAELNHGGLLHGEEDEEELVARFGGVALESAHPLLPKGLPLGEVPGAPLAPEQRQLIDEEDFYRSLFASNRTSPEVEDKYVTLVDIFRERDTFQYTAEDDLEACYMSNTHSYNQQRVPKLLSYWRETNLQGCAIVEESEFHKNWRDFTNSMDWSNVFCAGGAVLACVVPQQGSVFRGSDIDLWIYGLKDDEEANLKVKHIHSIISRNSSSRGQVVRTNRAITILGEYPYRHVQIILRLYATPLEVLLGFDIDSCCVGFDGDHVWSAKRFRRALTKRYNLINPTRRSLTYEPRLFKYAKRGFAIAIPGLRKADIDRSIFTRDVKKAQGLLKLCLFEHQTLYPELAAAQQQKLPRARGPLPDSVTAEQLSTYQSMADENQSDYTPEGVYIPWGPEWFTDQILKCETDGALDLLNFTDRAQFFQRPNKNPRQGNGYRHRHLFGVIEGTGFWCRLCKKEKKLQEDMSGRFIQKRLSWLKDCPAYQDIEKVFRRHLMTGSFQPILEPNWEKDVYVDQNRSTAELFFSQTPLAVALFSTAGKLVERTVARPDSGLNALQCRICAEELPSRAYFPSRNQLLQHSLITGHPYCLPSLPVAARSTEPLPALDRGPAELTGVATIAPTRIKPHKEHSVKFVNDELSVQEVPLTKPPSPASELYSHHSPPSAGARFGERQQATPLDIYARRSRLPISGRFSVAKTTRFMVQLAAVCKDGYFNLEDRGSLKELMLLEDSVVFGAFEAHELLPDEEDLVDTLRRHLARRRLLADSK